MPNSTSSIYLVLSLPMQDFSVYAEAATRLRKIMGRKAPDVLLLLERTLRCRDAHGLVEDYLESIHWPVAPRKPSAPRARIPRRSIPRHLNAKHATLLGQARENVARN